MIISPLKLVICRNVYHDLSFLKKLMLNLRPLSRIQNRGRVFHEKVYEAMEIIGVEGPKTGASPSINEGSRVK